MDQLLNGGQRDDGLAGLKAHVKKQPHIRLPHNPVDGELLIGMWIEHGHH
jgi:hypothetical protein